MYNNITLVKGRHQAIMNGDIPVFDSDGNILVQDIQHNNIFTVPVYEETLKFFNFNYDEEQESSIHNNGSSDQAASSSLQDIERDKSTASSAPTACWKDDNEVRCLIHLWQDHQNDFKTMKSRNVWTLISEKLRKTAPNWKKKTAIQCENKWKDIKRRYMEIKDHNNRSGNDPKSCKFYEELEEILGEKPCVQPVAVASNLNKGITINSEEHNDSEETNKENSAPLNSNQEASLSKKRKITRIQKELKDWSATLLADAKVREEAKERRHREAIAESRAAIDVYKDVMGKLIDKL